MSLSRGRLGGQKNPSRPHLHSLFRCLAIAGACRRRAGKAKVRLSLFLASPTPARHRWGEADEVPHRCQRCDRGSALGRICIRPDLAAALVAALLAPARRRAARQPGERRAARHPAARRAARATAVRQPRAADAPRRRREGLDIRCRQRCPSRQVGGGAQPDDGVPRVALEPSSRAPSRGRKPRWQCKGAGGGSLPHCGWHLALRAHPFAGVSRLD